MNKILTLIFLFTAYIAGAQNSDGQAPAQSPDVLKFKELEYDFSKIPQGKPVYHFFEIENTGKETIKLDNVQASCGCTTPEWNHEPIAPGTTAKIKVGYNAAAEGNFEKYITPTIVSLINNTNKIELWQELNFKILEISRNNNNLIKLASIDILLGIWSVLKHAWLSFLNQTLLRIDELLQENQDQNVLFKTKLLVKLIEDITGDQFHRLIH